MTLLVIIELGMGVGSWRFLRGQLVDTVIEGNDPQDLYAVKKF